MSVWSQEGRWLRLKGAAVGDKLLVSRFTGSEEISTLFSYEVDFFVPRDRAIPLDKPLNQSVTLEILSSKARPVRYFNGMVCRFRRIRIDHEWIHYRAQIVPNLWRLSREVTCRTFSSVNVPTVAAQLLRGYRVSGWDRLHDQYPAHNIITQYRESTWDFVTRLLEEEGIYFSFVHRDGEHEMVVGDRSLSAPGVEGGAFAFEQSTLAGGGNARDRLSICEWHPGQQVRSAQYTVRDRHFQLPSSPLQSMHQHPASVGVGGESYSLAVNVGEIYEPAAGFAHKKDGVGPAGQSQTSDLQHLFAESDRNASLRLAEELSQAITIEGASDIPYVLPGRLLSVQSDEAKGDYFVTRVEFEATQDPESLSQVGIPPHAAAHRSQKLSGSMATNLSGYHNRFTCLPSELEFRPARKTPTPVVPLQPAVVTSHPGDPILTDQYGRIKTRFFWDKSHSGGDVSCWSRIKHASSGSNFGMVTLPRDGHEVLVEFLDTDGDSPMVLGSLYNADNMPPFSLPSNRTQTGYKSHSYRGDSTSYSGFVIEDKESREHVHLHSERHMTHSAEGNFNFNTSDYHNINVGKIYRHQVGGLPGIDMSITSSGSSGSGTGDDSSSDSSMNNSGPFKWQPAFTSSPAFNGDLVFGRKAEQVLGLFSEIYFGNHLEPLFNPIGMAAAIGMPAPSFGPGFGMLTAAQGNCACVLGTSSSAVYGCAYKIQRGPVIELKSSLGRIDGQMPLTPAAKAMAILYAVTVIGSLFVNGMTSGWKGNLTGALETVMQQLFFSIWVTLESLNASIKLGEDTVWKSTNSAFKAATLEEAGLDAAADDITQMTTTLRMMVNNPLTGVMEESLADVEGSPDYVVAGGHYKISGPGVVLCSCPMPTSVCQAVQIEAVGERGYVQAYGSQSIHFQAGVGAFIDLFDEEVAGLITISHGIGGTTCIQSGPSPAPVPPMIMVSPEGITVMALSELKISVLEASITLTPLNILIAAGASSLTITPASITKSSVMVSHTAEAELSNIAPERNLQGAQVSSEAGMYEIL